MVTTDRSTTDSPEQQQARSDALDRVSDGVVSLDTDLRYTYVNRRAADLLDTDPESLRGEYIWDVFPEAQGPPAEDAIERAIETGQITFFERHNQELEKWWEVRVHPDDTGITIFFIDVTEKKERLSELGRADTVFQNTQDGLFIVDVEDGGKTFRVNQVNQAYEVATGVSGGEIQGKTIGKILDERESACIREKYAECVRKRESLEYEEYLTAFESGSWWETRIAPVIVDEEVTQIVGSTRNITDRKKRERLLQKFEQMVRNTGHAVVFTDVDGEIEYVNPEFERLTGYTAADAVGETPHLLSSGEHDEAFFADLWETVLDGTVWRGEIVNERQDGTQFIANHTIAPVTDASGKVTNFVAIYHDITERKQREQRLQTHELVVQTMNEVAYIVDEDKRIRFANDAALDFADAPREAIEGIPIGSVTDEMAAPDEDSQRFLDAIDALLDDVEPDVGEWIREPDGSETLSLEFNLSLASVGDVCVEQRFVPVELYDGTRGVVVIARDVTERKESEQTIKTHLEQAQSIGTVGSWHLDFDDNTLHWSDECYRIFGIHPDQPMTYERFLDSAHPEDRERLDEAWNAALKGEPYEIEHRIVVDDEVKWVRETAEITFDEDGEPVEGVGVVKDVTDRRDREREIIEQKQRYESLFNSIGGAVVVTDLDGHITTCNSGFADLFGYDSNDVDGTHLNTIIDENTDVERLLETTDSPGESVLVTYRKNSGQVFPGESRSSPLRTRGGDIRGYVIHIVDVSEAEENREQLQVLGRVFRHNIKNDMNVIQGHAELIRQQGPPAVLSDAEKILEKSEKFVEMGENSQRITGLLTDNAETVDVDLVQGTQQVVSDVQTEYPAATVQTDLATECRASAARGIDEAIQELVENAIIHSDREHPSVDIELQFADGMAELTVRDDGPGIPEQEWSVLTADGEINPLNHGTGLGLWFVKQVVRRSNGTLSFDTSDSGGASVTIQLPES